MSFLFVNANQISQFDLSQHRALETLNREMKQRLRPIFHTTEGASIKMRP